MSLPHKTLEALALQDAHDIIPGCTDDSAKDSNALQSQPALVNYPCCTLVIKPWSSSDTAKVGPPLLCNR